MELERLLEELARPEAWPEALRPEAGESVEVVQTHASAVFLGPRDVFKVKKPVGLGFLDFSTLEKRRAACEAEVVLNRRLAPDVYLSVVPVVESRGGLRFETSRAIENPGAEGEVDHSSAERDADREGAELVVVEHAVHMRRLPEERTLRALLERDELDADLLERLARRLAAFHADAESGPRIAASARWEKVAENCRDNLDVGERFVGETVSRAVLDRLERLTERELGLRLDLIERRALRGVPRDTHGDLRLDHAYWLAEREPPGDLVVIDCIEFNERFRHADPVADVAFLGMELRLAGRDELADAFLDAWLDASGDAEGRQLLPLYLAYRSAVRGKVRSIESAEEEVERSERERARSLARAHFLHGLVTLSSPAQRPCLLLVGGLPGTGKSTLARGLEERASFRRVASDLVRKELAGLRPEEPGNDAFGEGIYAPEWTERTYAECLRRAGSLVFEGRRVLVDASFREESRRRAFLDAAISWGVPALLIECEAPEDVVRERLASREGDASDADWEVYLKAARSWEPASASTARRRRTLDVGGTPEGALAAALRELERAGLR